VKLSFIVQGRTVSVNGTYRRRAGYGLMKTEQAIAFQRTIAFRAKDAMRRQSQRHPTTHEVGVSVDFHAANSRMDIDGPLKLILDAMEGIVYADDCQVRALSVRKHFDKLCPRLVVEVYELDAASAWEEALEPITTFPGQDPVAAGLTTREAPRHR
jgi:Holliday junction resolvase RusA-like endonuclease